MIVEIKKYRFKILEVLLILVIEYFIYNDTYNINNVSKGKLLDELSSRVETLDNNTKKSKNIYFDYPEQTVKMKWLDVIM